MYEDKCFVLDLRFNAALSIHTQNESIINSPVAIYNIGYI